MKFDLHKTVQILSRTPEVLEAMLSGVSEDWIKQNEGGETWSPYEVVGHLIHGEKTDWIPRAKIILSEMKDKTFIPFDRFAQQNEDASRSIDELLLEFRSLREENITTLLGFDLENRTLEMTGVHPELGPASLKELLSTWTVHDLGHIAQISRVMAKQYKEEVGPWSAYLGILKP